MMRWTEQESSVGGQNKKRMVYNLKRIPKGRGGNDILGMIFSIMFWWANIALPHICDHERQSAFLRMDTSQCAVYPFILLKAWERYILCGQSPYSTAIWEWFDNWRAQAFAYSITQDHEHPLRAEEIKDFIVMLFKTWETTLTTVVPSHQDYSGIYS